MKALIAGFRKVDDVAEYLIFDCLFAARWRTKTLLALCAAALAAWSWTGVFETPSPSELIQRGDRAWFAHHDMKTARKLYKEAARRDEKDVRALLRLGQSHRMHRKFDKALKYFRKAYDRQPNAITEFHLGEVYTHLKRPHVALGFLQASLARAPRFTGALVYQGFAYDGLKDYRNAFASYQRALKLSSRCSSAYFYRGITFINVKQYDAAIRDFQKVLELHPKETSALYNIACAHALNGESQKALHWLEKAVAEGFRDFDHLRNDPDLRSLRSLPAYEKLLARKS